jgi:hypothetical protein
MRAHGVKLALAITLAATGGLSSQANAQCTGWPVTCTGVPGAGVPGGGAAGAAAAGVLGIGLQLLLQQSTQPQATVPPAAPQPAPVTPDADQIAPDQRERILNGLRPIGSGSYTATDPAPATTTESLLDQLRPIGADSESNSALVDGLKPIPGLGTSPGADSVAGTASSSTSAADQLCEAAGQGKGCIGNFQSHGTGANSGTAHPQAPKAASNVDCGRIVGFSTPTPGTPVPLDCAGTADALDKVVPLLRSAEEIAKGRPLNTGGRAARCDVLSRDMDETVQITRRSVLAWNVYEVYEPGGRNLLAPAAFARLGSSDLSSACGGNTQTFDALMEPPESGYRAAVYRDETDPKKMFLVFRGTTLNRADWLDANVPQAAGLGSDYYARAIAFARILKKCAFASGVDLEVVGHSLGGGMADAAGVVNQLKTTSFNPAGVHRDTLPKDVDMTTASKYVTDYVVRDEPLNYRQDNPLAARAERYAFLLPSAPLAPVAVAAAGAKDLATLGTQALAGQQATRDPSASKFVSALYASDMPPAIGRRVTLEPDAGDADPLALHGIGGVIHAIVGRWNTLYGEYRSSGCLN